MQEAVSGYGMGIHRKRRCISTVHCNVASVKNGGRKLHCTWFNGKRLWLASYCRIHIKNRFEMIVDIKKYSFAELIVLYFHFRNISCSTKGSNIWGVWYFIFGLPHMFLKLHICENYDPKISKNKYRSGNILLQYHIYIYACLLTLNQLCKKKN